ncbi:MAG: AAA family ATPase [Rhodospirillales bacterium]
MLRKLTIENFFSFKGAETLDLEIARNATDPDGRFATPIEGDTVRIPRVAVIFGPNASGKTNLIRAIKFLRDFVLSSVDRERDSALPFVPFFADDSWNSPTKFHAEFDAEFIPNTGRQLFRYELEISTNNKTVKKESLHYYPEGRPRRLFVRNGMEIVAGKDFGLQKRDPVRSQLRDNASVISTLAKFNHPFSVAIYNNLRGIQITVPGGSSSSMTREWATNYYQETPECFADMKRYIRRMDLGIEGVLVEKEAAGELTPRFKHSGLTNSVRIDFESTGTENFYNMYPAFWYVFRTGNLIALDQFDNDIHPLLLPEIINLFQRKDENPYDAQLIMTCHDATLLEHLVKEEVFFTEKGSDGASHIFGLKNIQGVRRDSNIYAKYLAGVFGAVPRVA